MSVRMRHTSAHTRNRRSHHALTAISTSVGEKEGTLTLPHRLDEATGMYRGKQIAAPVAKKVKGEHAHGTHHEHVHRDEKSEAKPAEARAAELEAKTTARPRSRSGFGGGV